MIYDLQYTIYDFPSVNNRNICGFIIRTASFNPEPETCKPEPETRNPNNLC